MRNKFSLALAVFSLIVFSSPYVFAAADCGSQPSGQTWSFWLSSEFSTGNASTDVCPTGGTVTTQINYYQQKLCTNGMLTPVGAVTSKVTPIVNTTWAKPTCIGTPAKLPAPCGQQPSGEIWSFWLNSTWGIAPASASQCSYGGTITTQINNYQQKLCTDGKLTPVGAVTSTTTDVVNTTWAQPKCVSPLPCGQTPSGSAVTQTVSTTNGTEPATTAQCVYGGTQPVVTTVTQAYLCTNGKLAAQGNSVSTTADAGAPVCVVAVNGQCGLANGTTLTSAPVNNLCNAGTASAVSGNVGLWSWACTGLGAGTSANCSTAPVALTGISLSLPVVYPTNKLLITSDLKGGAAAATNITIQTIIQDQNAKIVNSSSQTIASVAAHADMPLTFSFVVPDNQTLPPGAYKILQGYAGANELQVVSTAEFTVPAATTTLNESFDDGRTALNTNVWNPYEAVNVNYGYTSSYDVPDAVETLPGQGLILRADQRSFQGFPYTAGEISSTDHFAQTYGHFEMRAKIASGAGTYSSFWLYPIDNSLNTQGGEIDVFENIGVQPDMMLQTLHFPASPGAQSFPCTSTTPWSQAYHVYGLDWTPTSVTWLMDGVACSKQTANIPNGPEQIIAGLVIGSAKTWGGGPDADTQFPAEMGITYIKAWQYPDMPAEPVLPMAFTGTMVVTPANPQPGDLITITGNIAAGHVALTDVTQTFAMYLEAPTPDQPNTPYYGLRSNPPINVAANSTGQFTVTYQLPADLPPGLYQFYNMASSTNGFSVQSLNAPEIMVGNPLPPVAPFTSMP